MNLKTRRLNYSQMTEAERAIHQALKEVNKLEANELLTNAELKLLEAKHLVSDFVDDKILKSKKTDYCQCKFAMIMRNEQTQKGYCAQCEKEIQE
jgi:hypothetical protein